MTYPNNAGTGGQGNPGTGSNGDAGNGQGSSASGGAGTGSQGMTAEEQLAQMVGRGNDNGGDNGSQGGNGTGDGNGTDNLTLEEQLERANARATELQRRARDLEKERNKGNAAVRRLEEIDNANRTETEKAQARAIQAEQAAAEARSETARILSASRHGLGPEAIEFLGTGTSEEIDGRAEALTQLIQAEAAKLVTSVQGQGGLPGIGGSGRQFPSQRPVASLRPGGSPSGQQSGSQTAEGSFRDMIGSLRNNNS